MAPKPKMPASSAQDGADTGTATAANHMSLVLLVLSLLAVGFSFVASARLVHRS